MYNKVKFYKVKFQLKFASFLVSKEKELLLSYRILIILLSE